MREDALHQQLTIFETEHFNFCTYQINVRRDEVEVIHTRVVDGKFRIYAVNEAFVNGGFQIADINAQTGGCICLRVSIYQEHFLAFFCQCCREIDCGCGLTHTTFLISQRNNFSHNV